MPDDELIAPQTSSDDATGRAQWFAVWVRSHFEQLVRDQLVAKGMHAFLPTINTWLRRGGQRHVVPLPMFPGYLFLRHAMDKHGYVKILQTRGVVRILGERWDRLVPIDEAEIAAVQRLVTTDAQVVPHPYLREGNRVRLTDGPLSGVEGVLMQVKAGKGLLVVSVELLQRSVAVEVDCTCVVSVGPALPSRGPRHGPPVASHV